MQACPEFRIRAASSPEDIELARLLFREYQQDLGIDLCFQSFEQELAALPGSYTTILLAFGVEPAGCVAVRPLSEAGVCELKRMYVRPSARRRGLGRRLVHEAMEAATASGFLSMKLDSLPDKMAPAIGLYLYLGFQECAPYTNTPGAVFLQRNLSP